MSITKRRGERANYSLGNRAPGIVPRPIWKSEQNRMSKGVVLHRYLGGEMENGSLGCCVVHDRLA